MPERHTIALSDNFSVCILSTEKPNKESPKYLLEMSDNLTGTTAVGCQEFPSITDAKYYYDSLHTDSSRLKVYLRRAGGDFSGCVYDTKENSPAFIFDHVKSPLDIAEVVMPWVLGITNTPIT